MVNDVRNTHMVEGNNISRGDIAEKDDEIQHIPSDNFKLQGLLWLYLVRIGVFILGVSVVFRRGPGGENGVGED